MAIKKFVAISYCFAFLAVYFSSIAYAFISSSMKDYVELPQTTAMNATVTAISSYSSWTGTLVIIGAIAIILSIIFFVISGRAMSSAI